MEQDTLLQRRQWIDILHIGRPAGDHIGDGINLSLRQRDQGQYIGCEGGAAFGDTVRWHHESVDVILDGLYHFGEDGRGEHAANLKPPTEAAQLFDQTDDHQRMTTQFKEMVVAADPFQS